MSGLFYLGCFIALWGILTMIIAQVKPKKLWETGKIQGFVNLMGEKGTQVILMIIGIAAAAGGVYLIIAQVSDAI